MGEKYKKVIYYMFEVDGMNWFAEWSEGNRNTLERKKFQEMLKDIHR